MPLTPFFVAVKQFYHRSTEKMLNKFPFGDSLLHDLLVLNPTKVLGCKVDILVSLAKRFPQLKLDAPSDIDTLKEEFRDFCLSSSELTEIKMYDCEGVHRGGSRIDLRGGLSIPRALARAKFYVLRPLLTSFPHTTSYTKKK